MKIYKIITTILLLSILTYSINLWNYTNPYEKLFEKKIKANSLQLKITSGTRYAPTEKMDLEVQLTNEFGQPVSGGSCTFNLYYPNKSLFTSVTATYLNYGIYYDASIKAPSIEGIYTYTAKCTYNSLNAYTSKCLQVKKGLIPIGTVEAPCDFFLNGSENDYNTFKEYVTTVKDDEKTHEMTSILKICWKE